MKHEILIMLATIILVAFLTVLLESYLGDTWLLVPVGIIIFLPFRVALYRYRKSKGIKDPMDSEKWWWP